MHRQLFFRPYHNVFIKYDTFRTIIAGVAILSSAYVLLTKSGDE